MKEGDYVLATKYSDGDPGDQFCVGFYSGKVFDRFMVVDSNGAQFRANGFRRCEPISKEAGEYIVENMKDIERGDIGLWAIKARAERQKKEATNEAG